MGTRAHSAERRGVDPDPGGAPFDVEYWPEHRLVLARFRGMYEPSTAWEGIAAIKAALAEHAVEGVIIDTRASEYTPTAEEAAAFAREFVAFLGRRRLAFITRLLVHYSLARQIAQQVQERGVEAEVFTDEQAALAWLRSPDTR